MTVAVKQYNLALPRAYAVRSVSLVEPYATPNEQERLQTLIAALVQKGRVLDARQEEFRIESITVQSPPRLADLEGVETWWYRHYDSHTKAEAQAPRRVRYRVRYRLVQRDGHWLVDRLELLKSEDVPVE